MIELVERVDGEVTRLRQVAAEHTATLSSLLLAAASQDEVFLDSLLRDGMQRDETLLEQCAQIAIEHEPSRAEQLRAHLGELHTSQDALTRQVSMAVQTETDALSEVVRALLGDTRSLCFLYRNGPLLRADLGRDHRAVAAGPQLAPAHPPAHEDRAAPRRAVYRRW